MMLHALTTEQLLRNVTPATAREATLLERIQSLHTQLSLLEKVLDDAGLSTDGFDLEGDLEDASKEVEELEKENSRLEDKVDELEDIVVELKDRIDELGGAA